jgi:hypothetical protein
MSQIAQSPAPDLVRTAAQPTTLTRKQRLLGVDVSRGVALLGMLATHAFPTFRPDGTPTVATLVAGGRSAATFVLVAGVGLALLSGGQVVVQGRERAAVAAGLAVRAVLIGALGLGLGLLERLNGISEDPILPFYGLMFLIAIPLLARAPLALAGVAAAAIALGLARLIAESDPDGHGPAGPGRTLLWEPEPSTSWWYLALPAPHSHTPVDAVHVLGSAMVVLGAALLLTRLPAVARLLSPLAVAGTMALTLYSAHLVLIATGVLLDRPGLLYLLMVAAALALAQLWSRWFGQGPLERVVAVTARHARRTVVRLFARRSSAPDADRRPRPARPDVVGGTAQLLRPLLVAGALALAFWAGGRTDSFDASAADSSTAPVRLPSSASAGDVAGDVERYCTLSWQIDDLDTRYPDQPETVLQQATPQLDQIGRAAPVEIRAAVDTVVAGIRVEGGAASAATAPDAVALERAETSIDAFEEERC